MPIMVHTPNQSNSKTGVPPIFMNADGNALTAWSISGQTVQNGTPTPDAPIQPQFVGVRTANLWDGIIGTDNVILNLNGTPTQNNAHALSEYISVEPNTPYIYHFYHNIAENRSTYSICEYDRNKNVILPLTLQWITENRDYNISFTTHANTAYIRINWKKAPDEDLMLNTGSTALPYEPYGYKIPITCGGQTTPVYLGQVQTVRRIKKLVLDGTERWNKNIADTSDTLYWIRVNGIYQTRCVMSHLQYLGAVPTGTTIGFAIRSSTNVLYLNFGTDVMNAQTSGNTVDGLKEYLASEYQAGHPVTVWYVLATPETGVVNEPLCKIGDYADTVSSTNTGAPSIPTSEGYQNLTVGTTVQPSNVSVSYNLPELSECSHIYVKTDGLPQTTIGYDAPEYSEVTKVPDAVGALVYTT